MSAIVDFRIIDRDKLQGLVDSVEPTKENFLWFKWTNDNYYPYLEKNSKVLKDIDSSGYIYINIIYYFDEYLKISLDKNELDSIAKVLIDKLQTTLFLIPASKKNELLEKINPANINVDDLISINIKIDGDNRKELALEQIEAIKVLRDNINSIVTDSQVLYFMIG